MIIMLMGPQACGKGTQGEMLSEKLGVPLIGMGDLLRGIPKNHPKYQQVQKEMKRGDLVDNEVTANLLKERVYREDCAKGYILDGWGRIEADLASFDPNPDKVVFISIPREETIRRISGRRICQSTGEVINIYTLGKDELAKCPGPLVQREDDTEDAVKTRLGIFNRDTIPVISKFRTQNKLLEVSGLGTPAEVFGRILKALEIGKS